MLYYSEKASVSTIHCKVQIVVDDERAAASKHYNNAP